MTGLVSRIDSAVLAAIAPKLKGQKGQKQAAIVAALGMHLPAMMARFDISTPLRIIHFLSQLAHESDGFCTTVEYASGAAYEGRADLGNVQKGDGKRFKGRGPIQLTGRRNYRLFTVWLFKIIPDCPDFEARPELVAEFPWAAWAAIFFWSTNGLNALADRDDLVAVTKRINGGRNGLADRAAYLAKARTVIAGLQVAAIVADPLFVTLRRGSNDFEAIETLQRALAVAGQYLLSIDGSFGPGTEGAVKTFQRPRGLTADGIVGAKTWDALKPFIVKETA